MTLHSPVHSPYAKNTYLPLQDSVKTDTNNKTKRLLRKQLLIFTQLIQHNLIKSFAILETYLFDLSKNNEENNFIDFFTEPLSSHSTCIIECSHHFVVKTFQLDITYFLWLCHYTIILTTATNYLITN